MPEKKCENCYWDDKPNNKMCGPCAAIDRDIPLQFPLWKPKVGLK
jgi:hypothetical protein